MAKWHSRWWLPKKEVLLDFLTHHLSNDDKEIQHVEIMRDISCIPFHTTKQYALPKLLAQFLEDPINQRPEEPDLPLGPHPSSTLTSG